MYERHSGISPFSLILILTRKLACIFLWRLREWLPGGSKLLGNFKIYSSCHRTFCIGYFEKPLFLVKYFFLPNWLLQFTWIQFCINLILRFKVLPHIAFFRKRILFHGSRKILFCYGKEWKHIFCSIRIKSSVFFFYLLSAYGL